MTWDVLDGSFSTAESIDMIPGLKASVIPTRLYSWLALNLLFTVSGILHIILQQSSSRPVVIDTAAVALTTDVLKLLNDNDIKNLNWRNMSYITKHDTITYDEHKKSAERILLKLESGDNGFVLARKND